MTEPHYRFGIHSRDADVRSKPSNYPEPYKSRMSGRTKRQLGDLFGIRNFGVNMTDLAPGAQSVLMHRHYPQDDLVAMMEDGAWAFRRKDGRRYDEE